MTEPVMLSPDPQVADLYRELEAYSLEHPLAEIGVFRRVGGRLSVRIIDPDFRGVRLRERNDGLWTLLQAAGGSADEVSVLLLLTPEEAAEAHFTTAEFDPGHVNGPVGFLKGGLSFREELDGHTVFVTVSRPLTAEGSLDERFHASFKFDFPPGIIAADDYELSVDAGEMLRDADYAPRWFEAPEGARVAAVEAARGRLERLAAA